jgi:hypothetical protein
MRFSTLMSGLVAGGAAIAASLAGCGGDDPPATTSTGGAVDCSPKPECPYAAGADCLAFTDNRDQTKFTLRMSQLSVTQPEALSKDTVEMIVSRGVRAKLPECKLQGDGTFNWLLEFDTATGRLRTGGAKPVADPDDGYCFTDETVTQNGMPFVITPIDVDAPITDGRFAAETTQDVVVPIYLDAMDDTKVVLLPLRGARLYDGTISADNNCIGKYNAENLDPVNLCLPEEGIPAFIDGGKLEGFITIEEADTVVIDVLGQTMCVLLSADTLTYGDGGSPVQKCKRDMNDVITLTGDWCAATNSAATADCKDAFKLGATFAASAAKMAASCP